jgi:hypothetical protein
MAKKSRKEGVNKSQLIRDYMAANPEAGPQAVSAAMKEKHGLDVTPQFVSTIKSNDKRKGGGAKAGIRRGMRLGGGRGAAAGGTVSPEALLAAKKFVHQMGGVQQAKAAVSLLAELLD